MSILDDFDTIIQCAHMFNWLPDWRLVQEIYEEKPNSFAVLTPFAYAYLEELIRSTTTDYGIHIYNTSDNQNRVKVGRDLIALSRKENSENAEYLQILDQISKHFEPLNDLTANGRNNVMHGHLPPRFWSHGDFYELIKDIALISKYAKF